MVNKVKRLFCWVAGAAKRLLYRIKKAAVELLESLERLSCVMRAGMLCMMLLGAGFVAAQTVGDYTAGTNALEQVAEEIVKYVPIAVKLCYAIAGVVAVVGAISVYIAMILPLKTGFLMLLKNGEI